MADQDIAALLAGLPPAQSLEGAEQRAWPNGLWGPKTASGDAAWYLPESMVGELPYRYQGVAAHGALAAIPMGPLSWLNVPYNGGYALSTILAGRTDPIKRVEDQLPPPPTYPAKQP